MFLFTGSHHEIHGILVGETGPLCFRNVFIPIRTILIVKSLKKSRKNSNSPYLIVSIRKLQNSAIPIGLGLSRSLSYGFMAQQRQQGKRLKPAGCPIRVSAGDRLREASGKFHPSPCRDFPEEN
jgi:hypothetical protein